MHAENINVTLLRGHRLVSSGYSGYSDIFAYLYLSKYIHPSLSRSGKGYAKAEGAANAKAVRQKQGWSLYRNMEASGRKMTFYSLFYSKHLKMSLKHKKKSVNI